MEELPDCVKQTRRHLKAIEAAETVQSAGEGLSDEDIAKIVTHSLNYHRRQYDTWMQAKLDKFADLPWGESALQDASSLTPSQEASRPESVQEEVSVCPCRALIACCRPGSSSTRPWFKSNNAVATAFFAWVAR